MKILMLGKHVYLCRLQVIKKREYMAFPLQKGENFSALFSTAYL